MFHGLGQDIFCIKFLVNLHMKFYYFIEFMLEPYFTNYNLRLRIEMRKIVYIPVNPNVTTNVGFDV